MSDDNGKGVENWKKQIHSYVFGYQPSGFPNHPDLFLSQQNRVMFLYLNHLIGGLCCRFRSKVHPQISRKKSYEPPVMKESEIKKASRSLEAIEKFVNLGGIALGFLQYLSLTNSNEIRESYNGRLRTRSSDYPSEQVVQNVIRSEVFSSLWRVPFCATLRIIHTKIPKHPLNRKLQI